MSLSIIGGGLHQVPGSRGAPYNGLPWGAPPTVQQVQFNKKQRVRDEFTLVRKS